MLIRRLVMENFRNYQKEQADFIGGVNLITGMNAQGKSNLLEAICYLSIASSFRGTTDIELIAQNQDYFYLFGEMSGENSGEFTISAALNRQKKKKWRIDQQPCQKLSDIVGVFHTVIFSPEDILLVKGGPGLRRRFLNRQMSQLYPEYCALLLRYNQVVKQRNHCLKQGSGELLLVWDQQMITLGSQIILRRLQTIQKLQPLAATLHWQLSQGEELTLSYQSQVLPEQAFSLTEQPEQLLQAIRQKFAEQLQRLQKPELIRGLCLCGPHRDDLLLLINGGSSRSFASQGQQRSAALALKLAELELARQIRGEYPVLLLDDVFSELDSTRQKNLLTLMSCKTQTLITSTDDCLPFPQGKTIVVDKGKLFINK